MSSSSSDSSSLENNSSHNSGNDSGSSGGRISVGETSSADVSSLVIAIEVFQGNIGVGSSRNTHGLSYSSLRVELLGVRRLSKLHAHLCMVCPSFVHNNQSDNDAKFDMLSYAHKIFFISYSLTTIIYAI